MTGILHKSPAKKVVKILSITGIITLHSKYYLKNILFKIEFKIKIYL
jgi:hypothetical protein